MTGMRDDKAEVVPGESWISSFNIPPFAVES